MKNMLTLIVLLSSWLTVYSQESYTETELKQKCDSIVEEANTLYRYETAAWNFTDMFLPKPELMETIQGILTYQQGDTIIVQSVLNYGFTQMDLHLITANCYPHNQRSQRVLEKNGFVYEGRLHQAELMHTGQIEDHLCYYLDHHSFSNKNNSL